MSKSLRFMLLGIAIMLFSLAGSHLSDALYLPLIYAVRLSRVVIELILSIVPVVGLVFVLIGFFTRD